MGVLALGMGLSAVESRANTANSSGTTTAPAVASTATPVVASTSAPSASVSVTNGNAGDVGKVTASLLSASALSSATPGVLTLSPYTDTKTTSAATGPGNTISFSVADAAALALLEPGSQIVFVDADGKQVGPVSVTAAPVNGVVTVSGLPFTLKSGASIKVLTPAKVSIAANTTVSQLIGSSRSSGVLMSPGSITNGDAASAHDLTIEQGAFDGTITDGAKALRVIKNSAGILTLRGQSAYSGGTQLDAGELRIGNDGIFFDGSSTPSGLGATSHVASGALGTGVVTITGGQLSGDNGVQIDNSLNINPGTTAVITLGNLRDSRDNGSDDVSNANLDYGIIKVPVMIYGPNSLTLGGNIQLTDSARFKVLSSVILGGAIFDAVGGTGKSLTVTGSGVLQMAGLSTYSGGTTLESGELRAEVNSLINGAAVVNSAQAAAFAAAQTAGRLNLANTVAVTKGVNTLTLSTAQMATAVAAGMSVGQYVVGPNITPGTQIIAIGATTVTLSVGVQGSVNAFDVRTAVGPLGTGPLTIKGGVISGNAIVGNAVNLGVAGSTGSVDVEIGNKAEIGYRPTSALTLSGPVAINQTANIVVSKGIAVDGKSIVSQGATISGPVSGKGFAKKGAGTLVLNNYSTNVLPAVAGAAVNSYAGTTDIQEGTVKVSDATDLGATTGGVKFNGGALDVSLATAARQAVAAGEISQHLGSIDAGQTAKIVAGVLANKTTFTNALTGDGALELVGGQLQVADANSYKGRTTVDPAGTLVLNKRSSIASSSDIVIKGTLDGSADGLAFSKTQPIDIQANYYAASGVGGLNYQGVLKVKDGTSFANADITVDIASRLGAPETAAGPYGGPSIVITGVSNTGSSSPISGVTLKVKPRAVYDVGVVHSEVSSTPIDIKDYFTATTVVAGVETQITDRSRIGAVTGQIVSALPIYTVSTTGGLSWYRNSYAAFGKGRDGGNFGSYLDQQISATSPNRVPWLLRVVDSSFSDGSQFTKFLNELSARPFADVARSGFERSQAVLGGLEDRIASLSTSATGEGVSRKFGYKQVTPRTAPAPAGPAPMSQDSWDAWLSVYGRDGSDKASAATGATKLTNAESGVQFGVERQMGNLTLGVTGATGWGHSYSKAPSTKISSDSWHLGLYAVAPIESLILDSSIMYGLTSNDSSRTPQISSILSPVASTTIWGGDRTFHGKFDSRDLSISVGVAYNLLAPDSAFQVAPVLRMTYMNYNQAGFSEFEAQPAYVDPFSYRVDGMSADKFLTKLGARFSYNTKIASSTDFGADLGTYWQHDWDNKANVLNVAMTGGLPGTSYQAVGRKSSSDVAIVNGGLQLTFNERYLVRGSAGIEFGGRRENLTGSVTFGIKF